MIQTIPTKTLNRSSTHFIHFLTSLQPQFKGSFMALSQSMLKFSVQLFSSSHAERVFTKLASKSKNQKQRKNWKSDETSYLFYIVDKYYILKDIQPQNFESVDWQNISSYIPGRSGSDCRFRFMAMTPKLFANSPWISSQKQLLVRIIQTQNSKTLNWKKISQKLYELSGGNQYRTGKKCRQQYSCFLNPNLKKGTWAIQEDYFLICLFEKYGRKWSSIAKEMQGRNQNAIKNRFFLLFQQKKALSLPKSDLNKRIKRKKEKLEREYLLLRSKCSSIEQILPRLTDYSFSQGTVQASKPIKEETDSEMTPSAFKGDIFIQVNTPLPASNQDKILISDESQEILKYINF